MPENCSFVRSVPSFLNPFFVSITTLAARFLQVYLYKEIYCKNRANSQYFRRNPLNNACKVQMHPGQVPIKERYPMYFAK